MISSPSFLRSFMTLGDLSAREIRISILPSLIRLDPLPPDSIIERIVGCTFEAREIEALPLIAPSLRRTVDGGGGGIGGGGGGIGSEVVDEGRLSFGSDIPGERATPPTTPPTTPPCKLPA